MAGAKDIGSLDTDRGFVASIASGVTSVANVAYSVADAFKDRVQAIYPGISVVTYITLHLQLQM